MGAVNEQLNLEEPEALMDLDEEVEGNLTMDLEVVDRVVNLCSTCDKDRLGYALEGLETLWRYLYFRFDTTSSSGIEKTLSNAAVEEPFAKVEEGTVRVKPRTLISDSKRKDVSYSAIKKLIVEPHCGKDLLKVDLVSHFKLSNLEVLIIKGDNRWLTHSIRTSTMPKLKKLEFHRNTPVTVDSLLEEVTITTRFSKLDINTYTAISSLPYFVEPKTTTIIEIETNMQVTLTRGDRTLSFYELK